jgi:hypothetical protein
MARQEVDALLRRTAQRRKAEITLSTGDSFVMYFAPLTQAEDDAIREAVEGDKRNNAYGYKVLIAKAEHEDATPMFKLGDIQKMRNEYAQGDMIKLMTALLDNGGVLADADPKSAKGGDQE